MIYYAIIFILGTLIGSFLNVVIYRFGTGKGLGGRSMCLACGHTLSWYELIPLVSFVFQKGKCRHCQSAISLQYFLVEAVTGILFTILAVTLYVPGENLSHFLAPLIYGMFVTSLLIVISVYDIRHKIIPNTLVYIFIVVSFLGDLALTHGSFEPKLTYLLAGLLLPLPFFILWYVSKGKLMGFGDIKLMMGMGFLLGISGGVTALLIAFWVGAIISLFLLLFRNNRFTMKSEIPFGPFLVLGTFIVFFFHLDFQTVMSWIG